jgi:RNA polymerase sigma-70 factor (ECF subfamily)
VVQESYLRAWKGIGKFRGEAAFSTWLYRITANTAATHVKRRRRQRAEPIEAWNEPADERHEVRPAEMAESADTLDRISAALDELPAKLRSVVVLKGVYGLSHEAIAEELAISVPAAKVRLHRARRKLRDVLYEEGVEARAV